MSTPPLPASHAFPPSARLRASAEFQAVFKGARRLSSPHLRLHAHVRAEATEPRLGVAVSKKVDKRAVGRNRIKRIARDCFRHQRARLPAGEYVLIAQPGAKLLSNDELRAQFLQLLERAQSLKPAPPTGTMPASPGACERPASES
ncbi:MAG: ribonuclease P protein component [Arenimonas sp.]|nr:ribonuclease P protein component [Arenimonas sp.]MBP6626065.1 ribonuclease P protein component [Arenimonas sp.]